MAQVLVRDLPEDVVERLKENAAVRGLSLEAHLRAVLEEASVADRSGLIELAEAISARARGGLHTDAADLVRRSRDSNWQQ